jgi:hypothetical protein
MALLAAYKFNKEIFPQEAEVSGIWESLLAFEQPFISMKTPLG